MQVGALAFVVALALVCGAVGALVGARWGAAQALREERLLQSRVEALRARVEGVEADASSLRREQIAFLEEADGILDTVERKRRRAAAHASNLKRAETSPQEQLPLTDEQERDFVRRRLAGRPNGSAGVG